MTNELVSTSALLVAILTAQSACVPRTHPPAAAPASDVVHVAPPTRERETDRASIRAALEQVRPGGTVQFAPGTYQVGGFIPVTVGGITLLGHSEGTTLRGCEPGEAVDYEGGMNRCAGLELNAARQTVRNLTFERMSWAALRIAGPRSAGQPPFAPISEGGHLIEGNTFRDSDSFDVISDAPEPIVIRDNTFINTYHAVAIQGRNVHFVDNRITAPAHDRIPYGRADIAIGVAQFSGAGLPCVDNVIAGNRIDGHSDGIVVGVFSPGTSCRGNVIRDNTIIVRPVTLPPMERSLVGGDVDAPMVGIPLRLLNYPQWCLAGLATDARVCQPDETARGAVLADNIIEGNRIIGAAGVAIEMLHASSNRIANNTISGTTRWDQFPEGVLRHVPGWQQANGAGIWISAGSDENEIIANVFEDIAAHAIVLEGDRNRVEPLSTSDSVRDLGSSNRVSDPAHAPPESAAAASDHTGDGYESRFMEIGGVRLNYLDFGGEGLPVLLIPSDDRTAYTFVDFAPRFTDQHRVLAITPRGTGESGGERATSFSTRDLATEAGDVLALLDSFGINRAVVLDRWTELPIYLAEQHPDRLAGLVILRGVPPEPDPFALRARDEAGLLAMYDRAGAAVLGRDPDEVAPRREHWYEPRYLRTSERIEVPTLIFMIEPETSRAEIEWEFRYRLTDWVASDPAAVPDPAARAFYERLASDGALQAQVQSYYEHVFAPAWSAAEAGFFRAFDDARIVRLEGENPRSYYQYRDAPDLIYPHIRQFLDELSSSADETPSAEAPEPDVVHVAPPTGEREADRASILAAFEQVQPGGTVQFAPGTYLVGELITVAVPAITLLGHPEGTTLRGCERDAYAASQADEARATDYAGRWTATSRCGLFELTGGRVTIRSFTFEQTRLGLILGCCYREGAFRPTAGGYLIEHNTFRDSDNGVRPLLASPDTTVIRANRFINTFHAVSSAGSATNVLDNDISVPQPARVPAGHPGFAIGFGPIVPLFGEIPEPIVSACEHNVVEGNRIEGHETGIVVFGDPGTVCRRNVIRENTIIVRRVPLPRGRPAADWIDITNDADSTIVGVPLTLHNPNGEGIVEENVIERNRVIGAEGIGIEILHATRNRIVDNTITGVQRREPFPGNTLGGDPDRWRAANGSGIWVSAGSEENEILGNTFDDIAAEAVVLEGDRNRVETRSANDHVRDVGRGNRVGAPSGDRTDPSPHTVRFVTIAPDVHLEVLDWGGSGEPLVLLAGMMATAHTWDDFATRFTDRFRVVAVTRRGFGASSRPADGYDLNTLVDDIRIVLDSLGVERAALVGHSYGAAEMVRFASRWPDRVSRMVNLDGMVLSDIDRYFEAMSAVPGWPVASGEDRASLEAFSEYITRIYGVRLPDAEIRARWTLLPDGTVGEEGTPHDVPVAILHGTEFTRRLDDLRIPLLAIRHVPGSAAALIPWYGELSPEDRDRADRAFPALQQLEANGWAPFTALSSARVIDFPDANHHLYISHAPEVADAMREFLLDAPSRADPGPVDLLVRQHTGGSLLWRDGSRAIHLGREEP